ncbi:MAG: acetate kinase [Candidatus Jacksonbacteria bacterium]
MILSINAGSTSLKYKLFDQKLRLLADGEFSDCQIDDGIFKKAAEHVKPKIQSQNLAIVHRVVHGGPKYREPIKLTPAVIKEVRKYNHLAPMHNPYNIKGIELGQKYFPKARQYAVFDTGFYQTLPDCARIYPLPFEFYQKYKIQKYGFHGISHQYVLEEAKTRLKINQPNIISLHLGAGCSITAVQKGKAIDTSMGWSPMEGVMMWSRSGDIDLGIALNHLDKFKNWEKVLNYKSGLKGISGCKNYLDLMEKYEQGDKKARLAMDMFVYRIQKYIGAYYAALKGKVDAIAFTGKIGAGEALTRDLIMQGLGFLQAVKKLAIKPNEELMMAKMILNLKKS